MFLIPTTTIAVVISQQWRYEAWRSQMPAPGALNLGEWGRDTVVYIFGICVYLGWVCSVGYFLLGSFMAWKPISAESETEIKFVFPHLFCDAWIIMWHDDTYIIWHNLCYIFREKEDHEKELFKQWKRLNHQYTESALTNTTMKSLLENFSQYHQQEKTLPHEQQNMTNEICQIENKFDPFHDYI